MTTEISEVQITPIKSVDGLVAFASIVFNRSFYLGSIGIYTRPNGGYRLTYPTRKLSTSSINIFHPIERSTAECVEEAIIKKFEEVMRK